MLETVGVETPLPLREAAAIVGREAELDAVDRWIGGPRPALLEIEGEGGIGKTTLLDAAVAAARDAGATVLTCRPVEVETAVSYGALATLLEAQLAHVGDVLPAPRLAALEGAFRLRELPLSSLDETAVALGALSVLEAAAARGWIVVAIDDVQWLDASSRAVLTYALRNLRLGDNVCVVTTARIPTGRQGLELGNTALIGSAERLSLGRLSIGALHRIVHRRLGASLSRPKVVRLHTISGGNPLHAIELARIVATAAPHEEALNVPASLADVLRARVEPLSVKTRRVLVTVAAAGSVRLELLAQLAGAAEIDEAVEHGVLVLDDEGVRLSHPLLASTVYGDAGELLRARVHLQLARLAGSREERARHLALAGSEPDEQVAAEVEAAGETAIRRGAHWTAAGLYERAASLTPAGEQEASQRRLLSAATAHFRAGEPGEARRLLEAVSAEGGRLRFEALWRLGLLLDETVGGDASAAAFSQALQADDPVIVSQAYRGLAQALSYVGSVDEALGHADAAVGAAEPLADRRPYAYALAAQALLRKMAGRPDWRDPLAQALTLEATFELAELDGCPSAFASDILRLALEIDAARSGYDTMLARAVQRGDVRTETWCLFGLAATEIASGRWSDATRHAEELAELSEQTSLLRLPALRTLAHLALLHGDVSGARSLLTDVVSEAEPAGELHNLRGACQLEGLLELSLGDPAAAIAPLERARLIANETAIGAPGLLLFVLDEIEARAATGDTESAGQLLRDFEARCARAEVPALVPLLDRARGLVESARGQLAAACAALERAVDAEDAVPLPLERARTRLALGRVLRRLRRRSQAHAMLTDALERFESLGAPLWAERAREDRARIGGRARSNDDLTPTEEQIAELVAAGMTNREVAATLFVTAKTVESALTRVYRKLGVRSRTELARRLDTAV